MPKALSFSQRIAIAIIVVVMAFVIGIGVFSYNRLYGVAYQNMEDTLSYRTEVLSDHLAGRINGLYSSLSEMSANTLIGNALVDDLGRDVYLAHFLLGFQKIEGIPITVLVTDFMGRSISSNSNTVPLLVEQGWVANAIESNEAHAFLSKKGGDYFAVLIKPVLFANTGLPEGALIYQFALNDLMKQAEVTKHIKSSTIIGGIELALQDERTSNNSTITFGTRSGPKLTKVRPLKLTPDIAMLNLNLRLYGNPQPFTALLKQTLNAFFVIGAITLLIAIAAAYFISRLLTTRLEALEHNASIIAQDGYTDKRLPATGNDEISSFANAFNAILDRLEIAYIDLEEQSELKLRKLRQAVEQSQVTVVITDIDGTIEYVNPMFEKTTGYSTNEAIGKNPRILKSGHTKKEEYAELWYTITNGRKWNGEFINKRKDGTFYWEAASIAPIKDPEGKITGFVAVKENITERKKAEEALLKAKAEADKANRAKSEFLSSMSHELRTPLNAIFGFAQLLEHDSSNPLTEKQKEYTEYILKGGEHLLELIDQVLELARIEAGKLSIKIEDVLVCEVLHECIPLIQTMADKRNINFDSHVKGCNQSLVRADRTRIKQVLLNLLSNAVKYNRDGGSISISAHITEKGMFHMAIIDTGLGISEEHQAKLFDAFERLGHEASNTEGTGIGLTIIRKLLHLMDGEIGFESTVGEGSTFWFEVPLAVKIAEKKDTTEPIEVTAASTTRDTVGDSSKRYTVLYIEDNPSNLALMQQIISNVSNLNMISTHTAELGIKMAEAEKPDIIFMDIHLPGMSGIEAAELLAKPDTTRDIPIIAVSADVMSHQIEEIMKSRFTACLTKPLQIQALLETLHKTLANT